MKPRLTMIEQQVRRLERVLVLSAAPDDNLTSGAAACARVCDVCHSVLNVCDEVAPDDN